MARRRSYLERSHDGLARAAESHAKLAAGEPHPDETGEAPPESEPSKRAQASKAQRRNEGGKFA